jgi:hypothetical protein
MPETLMARNTAIYISSDAVGIDISFQGSALFFSHLGKSQIAALPFAPRLNARSSDIFYGAGDNPSRSNWNPLNYGLVIFIISPSRHIEPSQVGSHSETRSPNWYRLQSELQKIEEVRHRKDAPSTLMFVHSSILAMEQRGYIIPSVAVEIDYDIRVLQNILEYGRSWIEYKTDEELAELLEREIGFFERNLGYPLERADGSWRITLERAIQSKSGARWIEDKDRFRLDTSGTDTDERIARDLITAQIHADIRKKAEEFLPIAKRLSNSVGWRV